jgi:hypothetical protein
MTILEKINLVIFGLPLALVAVKAFEPRHLGLALILVTFAVAALVVLKASQTIDYLWQAPAELERRALFGDQFGAINAVLTLLGFGAVLITLWFQILALSQTTSASNTHLQNLLATQAREADKEKKNGALELWAEYRRLAPEFTLARGIILRMHSLNTIEGKEYPLWADIVIDASDQIHERSGVDRKGSRFTVQEAKSLQEVTRFFNSWRVLSEDELINLELSVRLIGEVPGFWVNLFYGPMRKVAQNQNSFSLGGAELFLKHILSEYPFSPFPAD